MKGTWGRFSVLSVGKMRRSVRKVKRSNLKMKRSIRAVKRSIFKMKRSILGSVHVDKFALGQECAQKRFNVFTLKTIATKSRSVVAFGVLCDIIAPVV